MLLYSVLTSLSAWQSSGISSSWNSGRLLHDYKWLKRMNSFKEVKRSRAKSPTKTCKRGKSEDTQRIRCCHGLPFKPLTGHCKPEHLGLFLRSHGNSWPPKRCRWDFRHLVFQEWHILCNPWAETHPNQQGSTPSVAPSPPLNNFSSPRLPSIAPYRWKCFIKIQKGHRAFMQQTY